MLITKRDFNSFWTNTDYLIAACEGNLEYEERTYKEPTQCTGSDYGMTIGGGYVTDRFTFKDNELSKEIKRNIDFGIDVNAQEKTEKSAGNTALIVAASKGRRIFVEQLLQAKNIDINKQNKNGDTAIMAAASSKDSSEIIILDLLSQPRINTSIVNNKGNNALMCALAAGNNTLAKILLEKLKRIDINTKNMDGKTAFLLAAGNCSEEIVRLLLTIESIDIYVKDNFGNNVLMCAASTGNAEVFKLLLAINKKLDINAKNNYGSTALILGATHRAIVELLLARNDVDVNAKNSGNVTALFEVLGFSHHQHLITFVDSGISRIESIFRKAKVYGDIIRGEQALKYDTELQELKKKKILVEYNAPEHTIKTLLSFKDIDFNLQDNTGNTLLMSAITTGNTYVANFLLSEKTLNVNIKNNNGSTALMLAIKNGDTIAELLLARNDIDFNAVDNNNNTAFTLAAKSGNTSIAKLLLKNETLNVNAKNNEGDTALILASHNNRGQVVELIASRNDVDINARNANGCTALFSMVNNEIKLASYEVISYLVARKDLNVNARTNDGDTPLMLATMKKVTHYFATNSVQNCPVKRLLTRKDIDLNAKNAKGDTAYMLALKNDAMLSALDSFLMTRKLDFKIKNKAGQTALSLVDLIKDSEKRNKIRASIYKYYPELKPRYGLFALSAATVIVGAVATYSYSDEIVNNCKMQ